MGETLTLRGTLTGHGGWVTAIATTPEDPNMILSSSRDKVNIFSFLLLFFFLLILIYSYSHLFIMNINNIIIYYLIIDCYCLDFNS